MPASRAYGCAPRPTREPAYPSRSCGPSSGCSRSLRRPSTATAPPAACSTELGVCGSRTLSFTWLVALRLRIDDGQVIAALFERSVDGAVGVHGRITLVARDLVVQIDLRIGPVPQRDDDVALPALRTRRSGGRQLSMGNAVGPVRIHRQRALTANLVEAGTHPAARLAGLESGDPTRLSSLAVLLRMLCGISRVALSPI